MHILYCNKCGSWKEFAKGIWKKLTQLEWFDFQFNPTEHQISPVNQCPQCKGGEN